MTKRACVAGAGGFIGGHLVNKLVHQGFEVVAVDIKPKSEWFQLNRSCTNLELDLREREAARSAVSGSNWVFNLAADMGGMGFIEHNRALCMISSLINTHLLLESRQAGVNKFFFASSACVYPSWHQDSYELDVSLRESDAYPADPEDGYGWEKLFSERMCRHFHEDFGLDVAIARFHNVYGPYGTYHGGREKAPAAACRKVIQYVRGEVDSIEIWGSGQQLRSFTFIDDCIDGIMKLMESNFQQPLNIGSSETISILELYEEVARRAGINNPPYRFDIDAPLGVKGRSSNNELCLTVLDWEPRVKFAQGISLTYDWILSQMSDLRG